MSQITINCFIFATQFKMVVLAQLVRASDCGSEGRGFESHTPPKRKKPSHKVILRRLFAYLDVIYLQAETYLLVTAVFPTFR